MRSFEIKFSSKEYQKTSFLHYGEVTQRFNFLGDELLLLGNYGDELFCL